MKPLKTISRVFRRTIFARRTFKQQQRPITTMNLSSRSAPDAENGSNLGECVSEMTGISLSQIARRSQENHTKRTTEGHRKGEACPLHQDFASELAACKAHKSGNDLYQDDPECIIRGSKLVQFHVFIEDLPEQENFTT